MLDIQYKMYDLQVSIEYHDCNCGTCSGIKSTVSISDGGYYSKHDINVMLELLEKIDDYEYKVVIINKTDNEKWDNVPWFDSKPYSYDEHCS